jgi:hypothetical protein
VGQREAGVDADRGAEELARRLDVAAIGAVEELAAAQVELVGRDVVRRRPLQSPAILRREHAAELLRDQLGDLLLDGEDVLELAVEALRPHLIAVVGARQLNPDAQAVAGLAHAAVEHRGDAEPGADLAHVVPPPRN